MDLELNYYCCEKRIVLYQYGDKANKPVVIVATTKGEVETANKHGLFSSEPYMVNECN